MIRIILQKSDFAFFAYERHSSVNTCKISTSFFPQNACKIRFFTVGRQIEGQNTRSVSKASQNAHFKHPFLRSKYLSEVYWHFIKMTVLVKTQKVKFALFFHFFFTFFTQILKRPEGFCRTSISKSR